MPDRSVFAVQMFERRDGELVAGNREITTREAAVTRARHLAATAAGAAVICLTDAENGTRRATYVAAFGDVPEPYVECRLEDWPARKPAGRT